MRGLGEFERSILLAILRLRENAYGMTIWKDIRERTGKDVAIGAVYTVLTRLEHKGFVSSWTGEPTPERGGRRKRYFKIEAPGARALNESMRAIDNMAEGLGDLIPARG